MKKLLFLLLPLTANAQCGSELEDTLSFTASKEVMCYATKYCDQSKFAPLRAAIASASAGAEMNDPVTVVITEEDVLDIMYVLREVPEIIAADYNATLREALLPKLSGRPCLATEVQAIFSDRDFRKTNIVNEGAAILEQIRQAIDRQE